MNSITDQFKQALEPQTFNIERGGPAVKLKRIGLMDLIIQGRIPDGLSTTAAKVASKMAVGTLTAEELKQYGEVVDAVCCAAFVEPRVNRSGEGEAFKVSEIPFAWKVKVFNWASTSLGVLHPFRGEPAGAVVPPQPEPDL